MLIDHLRSHALRATDSLEDAEHISDDEVQFFDIIDRAEERDALKAAMDRLPKLQKEAVYRKHILLEATADIANSLGKSEEAVRQLVSRGCRKLKDLMSGGAPDQYA
jgi:RNA polymerase sigma factor (sigma-70 family)